MALRISFVAGLALMALQAAPAGAQTLGGPGQSHDTLTPAAQPAPPPATQPPPSPATQAPMDVSADDRAFIIKAAMGGLGEVEMGQLAANQAAADPVKSFGQHMVSDHSAADQKLKTIADAAGISLHGEPGSAEKQQEARLEKLHGRAFDRRYTHDEITAHKETIALFKREVDGGSNPQLKQFASDTLPTLQEHLTEVEGLTGKK
jgi:putative membrane protein